MLRTICIRNDILLKDAIRRIANSGNRSIGTRCLTVECSKRIQSRNHQIHNKTSLRKPSIWKVDYVRGYCSGFPSHTKVTLPALSPTMESGSIVSWEKKEGDKLNEGDLLAEIETDKATMGFETPEEGYLAKILIQAGTKDVKIGKLVCIIVENESDVAAFKDFKDTGGPAASASPPSSPSPASAAPTVQVTAPPPPPPPPQQQQQAAPRPMTAVEQRGPRVYASPMAKRLAETQQLRLEGQGTGMYGSITSKDLAGRSSSAAGAGAGSSAVSAMAGMPKGAAYVDIPVSGTRAIIAKRLLESKVTIPHYYLTVDINMEQIMKLRSKFNKRLEKEGVKLSVNDFVIKACALACKKVPETNSSWMGNFIRMYDSVDLSVAVDTDKGLITPIVNQADRIGLIDINKTVKELATKARENKLQPHEFQGGTITVSNLGMFGVSQFCAVINPPQSCILAVGGTQKRLILDADSEKGFKECSFMSVTLSCDHRSVDGAVGARWLQHFQRFMEDPHTMIL